MKTMQLTLQPSKLQSKFKMRTPRIRVQQSTNWANSDIPQTYTNKKK